MNEEIVSTMDLLAEVLRQAFIDYAAACRFIDAYHNLPPKKKWTEQERYRAKAINRPGNLPDVWDSLSWVDSDQECPMSYRWVCDAVGLDTKVMPAVLSMLDVKKANEKAVFRNVVMPLMTRLSSPTGSVYVPEECFED